VASFHAIWHGRGDAARYRFWDETDTHEPGVAEAQRHPEIVRRR